VCPPCTSRAGGQVGALGAAVLGLEGEPGPQPATVVRGSGPERFGVLRVPRISRILAGMNWTTPAFEELKMDAEIGSYQEDGEWPPIVEPAGDASDAE
jgi:hypothetical protein